MSFSKDAGNMKRKATVVDDTAKKGRFNNDLEIQREQSLLPNLKMDSLPSDMLHLGGDRFTYVNTFQKQTRVHIRQFSKDSSGFLRPTKNGVSLKLAVWSELMRKLCHFKTSDSDAVLTVKKDVCVFNETVNENVCVIIQRLFQRKDLTYHLQPEKVVLRGDEFLKFCGSHDQVLDIVKYKLLTYTLKEYVVSEMNKYPDDDRWDWYDCDTPQATDELTNTLCKYLTEFLSEKIFSFVKRECDFCNCGFLVKHNCMTASKRDCFDIYFEQSLYDIDWHALAIEFVKININRPYLKRIGDDYFAFVDSKMIFEKVEDMYVNERSTDVMFTPL